MKLILRIERFNPETDREPCFHDYPIEAAQGDRVLDLLMNVKSYQDGTLTFRRSCAHGVCGSDAMIINGNEALACKTLARDVAEKDGDVVTIQPLRNLPVQKDLAVDQSRFFETYRSVKPFLINTEPAAGKERTQLPDDRKKFDDATNCILCESCYSACPVIREKNSGFVGPASIVQAARFNDDSRDRGFEERLEVLDAGNGVWPCENHFRCTQVCPRGIKVTKLINLTKKRISAYKDTRP